MKEFKLRRFWNEEDELGDYKKYKAEYLKDGLWRICEHLRDSWQQAGTVPAPYTASTDDIFDRYFFSLKWE